MKKIQLMMVSMVVLLLTNCAGLNMTPYANNPAETKVLLSEANYKIVKEVSGEWSATYVLGIGGVSQKSLTTNAIGEMYKNAELKGNQQIINITTTKSVESWCLVYAKYRVVARGYVIEFEE